MRIPGASRSSDEIVRKTSGRHAGGGYLTVEFSSDEPGPEDLRLTLAYGGLHIARQEDMENVVSRKATSKKHSMAPGLCLKT